MIVGASLLTYLKSVKFFAEVRSGISGEQLSKIKTKVHREQTL